MWVESTHWNPCISPRLKKNEYEKLCGSGEWKRMWVNVHMCIWKKVLMSAECMEACRRVFFFYLGRWSSERGSVCSWHAQPPHDKLPHNAHTRWANFHGWREESCCCYSLHKDLTGTEQLGGEETSKMEKRRGQDQKHVTYCHLETFP